MNQFILSLLKNLVLIILMYYIQWNHRKNYNRTHYQDIQKDYLYYFSQKCGKGLASMVCVPS